MFKRVLEVFLLLLFITSNVSASTWQKYWVQAVEKCEQKEFVSALPYFNLAIACLEKEGDAIHPYVYVDRARLYLLLERYAEALTDLNIALENKNLTPKEIIRATLSRMTAKSNLGIEEGVLDDLKLFAATYEYKPVMEITDDYIIIRNAPDAPCYREIMTYYFIDSGVCESENDIQIMESGIWIIKRKPQTACKTSLEQNCHFLPKTNAKNVEEKIKDCKTWCDRTTLAAMAWCGKNFNTLVCQAACAVAVNELQQGCYWCCEGEGFYQRCVKPFEQIVKHIKAPCDPMWD